MGLADELAKLEELHRTGALSDTEFAAAKDSLLRGASGPPPLGAAAAPADPLKRQSEVRQWCMLLHLSQLAGFVVPLGGWIAPIVIWQIKKNEMPEVDVHGKIVVNWLISAFIYGIGSAILAVFLIGIPLLLALIVLCIVFPILGGIKANNGEVWEYPMSIRFLS